MKRRRDVCLLVLPACLLTISCIDSPTPDGDGDLIEVESDERVGELDSLANTPAQQSQDEVAWQVTVLDEDQPDIHDPNVLHVPAPDGKKAFVVAGAKSLLGKAVDPDDPGTIVQAQRIMASIAGVDRTVAATVTGVSAPKPPDGGIGTRYDVTFATSLTIEGQVVSTWTQEMRDMGPQVACGIALPDKAQQYLMFLRDSGDAWSLLGPSDMRPVVEGEVKGYSGLTLVAADLKEAVDAGKDVQP